MSLPSLESLVFAREPLAKRGQGIRLPFPLGLRLVSPLDRGSDAKGNDWFDWRGTNLRATFGPGRECCRGFLLVQTHWQFGVRFRIQRIFLLGLRHS